MLYDLRRYPVEIQWSIIICFIDFNKCILIFVFRFHLFCLFHYEIQAAWKIVFNLLYCFLYFDCFIIFFMQYLIQFDSRYLSWFLLLPTFPWVLWLSCSTFQVFSPWKVMFQRILSITSFKFTSSILIFKHSATRLYLSFKHLYSNYYLC